MVSWTGRQRLRFRWYRLRLTVREMNTAGRIVQLSANGRAPSTMHSAGSQMTGTPTGLATTADQKLPAAPRAAVIAGGGHCLPAAEPGAVGVYLVEPAGPQCLADLGSQICPPPLRAWPDPQAGSPPPGPPTAGPHSPH